MYGFLLADPQLPKSNPILCLVHYVEFCNLWCGPGVGSHGRGFGILGQGLSVHVIIRLGMAPTIFSIKEIGRLRMDSGFSHHQKGRRGNYNFSSTNFRQSMLTINSKSLNPISRALHCTFWTLESSPKTVGAETWIKSQTLHLKSQTLNPTQKNSRL